MRSAIVMTAALATAALASPLQHLEKRKMETVYHEVVETQVVTITRTGTPPKPTIVYNDNEDSAAQKQPEGGSNRYQGGAKNRRPTFKPEPTSEAAQAPTEAPTYEPPADTETSDSNDMPEQETPAPSGGGPDPQSYAGIALNSHNIHRENHSVAALTWSDSLAATALKIAETCYYDHKTDIDTEDGGYGQNIAAGVEGKDVAEVITNLFYGGEVDAYAYASKDFTEEPDMSNFRVWGHFSQIVWQDTTEVGCATKDCTSTGLGNTGSGVMPFFTVCNYKTPGNYGGKYKKNVHKGGKKAAVYAGKDKS